MKKVTILLLLLFIGLYVISIKKNAEETTFSSAEIVSIKPFLERIELASGVKIKGVGVRYWDGANRDEVMVVIKSEDIFGNVTYRLKND